MSDFEDYIDAAESKAKEGVGGTRFGVRCSVCNNPDLASEVADYAAGRQNGTISLSVNAVWFGYFGPNFGVGCANTIRTHIRMHLGIHL